RGFCRRWHLLGGGFSAGLFLDLVFPHAASPAGDRRRRFARSAHARCAAAVLGRYARAAGAFAAPALSPGGAALRSRVPAPRVRSPRPGVAGIYGSKQPGALRMMLAVRGQGDDGGMCLRFCGNYSHGGKMKNLDSLMAAYLAVWAIFFVYHFTVARRVARLQDEIARLKQSLKQ